MTLALWGFAKRDVMHNVLFAIFPRHSETFLGVWVVSMVSALDGSLCWAGLYVETRGPRLLRLNEPAAWPKSVFLSHVWL